MIKVEMDQSALQQVQQRLAAMPPRLIAAVYRELKPLLYQAFSIALIKYFAGNAPKRGPAGDVLSFRTGELFKSALQKFEVTTDGMTLEITAAADTPYAYIQEYGGFTGRKPPFKKKDGHRPYIRPRPYLRPALQDLQNMLPGLLEQAIQQASANPIQ
jgi:phage gpG-like protein